MANENLTININTKANTVGVEKVKLSFAKLKELGGNVSLIGVGLTALFTAPIAGIIALISQNEKLKKSFLPVTEAVQKLGDKFTQTLLPVVTKLVEQMVPKIVSFIDWIGGLITKFQALPEPVQNAIFGFVGFLAILGPGLVIIGQMITFAGSLGTVIETLGIKAGLASGGVWAFVAPVAALAAGIYALIKLVQMDEFKQVWALFVGKMGSNDPRVQGLITAKTYQDIGGGQAGGTETGDFVRGLLNAQPAGGAAGQAPLIFNYSPQLSTASRLEAEANLRPVLEQMLRQSNGR